MSKPITKPFTFATQNGPIPLSQLDSDLDTLYTAVNDPATYTNYLVDAGSTNSIVVTFSGGLSYSSYKSGDTVVVKVANTNTGSTTLNINSIGSKTIKNPSGANLNASQLVAGGIYVFAYDGTNFQIIGFDTASSSNFTGNPTLIPPSGVALNIVEPAGPSYGINLTSSTSAGNSFGIAVLAGTNSSDNCVFFRGAASGITFFRVRGDGQVTMNEATLGNTGAALNAATYESGSFTGTLTGMTSVTTGTVNWVRTGNLVSMYLVNAITGTSNTTSMTMTGIPAIIQPANPISCECDSNDNGTAHQATLALLTGGTITFFKMNASATYTANNYTNAGTKGLNGQWEITYPIQ
jgi:hypothetical protein